MLHCPILTQAPEPSMHLGGGGELVTWGKGPSLTQLLMVPNIRSSPERGTKQGRLHLRNFLQAVDRQVVLESKQVQNLTEPRGGGLTSGPSGRLP